MTCDEVKRELVLRLIGLGAPEKDREIEAHARTCANCAKRLEKARAAEKALKIDHLAQDADFEASWQIIEARSVGRNDRGMFSFFSRRWALAGAIVIVFVLGAIAGRMFLFGPKKAPAATDMFAEMGPELAWRNYADRLELLLVDFGNRADVERPADYVRREKALVDHILAETRALKSLLAGRDDDARLSLLREAEALLGKIADIDPTDKSAERSVAKIVRQSPLKAKLRKMGPSESIL
jgi:hypothetical protein